MQGHSAPPATSTTHQLAAQPRKVRLSFRKRSTDVEKAAHQFWRFATTATRAVGGPPPAPSEGKCPLAPPRPRERGGGVKSDGSRHTLACLGSHWWFRVFCSHERAISSQLRLRCRGASRVRLVVRHTRHRRAVALWHLPALASVGEEPNQAVATEHSGLLGLALVVSCLSTPRTVSYTHLTLPTKRIV